MIDFLHNNFGYLLSGISVGGQYALIAIGYTMVYGILRLINFAHGDVFMVAGLIMVYAIAGGLPMWLSIILVLVLTVVLGVVIERVAYKPLRSSPRMSVMISAIGVSYLLQNCALYFTGGLPRSYPVIPFLTKSVKIWGATTKMVTVVTPILTILLVIVLVLLIKYTKIGMAMRAVSKDFETSQLMGIKINSVISFTFVIGCFLAAVGSMLYFSNYTRSSPHGTMPGLKAFVRLFLWRHRLYPRRCHRCVYNRICENIIRSFGQDWTVFSDAFTFVLLIVVLLVKPTGIFGEKATDKV